jgi:hypothetical protein
MSFEQPELALEHQTYDHYTIELRKGQAHDEQTVRHHTARSREDAESMIEALRDTTLHRDEVTWQAEEVNGEGKLYGLAPGGVVFTIAVVPPLTTDLS